MARTRDLPDSHPDKWVYSQHTQAKHEILRRYLGAWFSILGHHNPLLIILDGFAGKGTYYRAALLGLESSEADDRPITVTRNRRTPTGRAPRGMKYAEAQPRRSHALR